VDIFKVEFSSFASMFRNCCLGSVTKNLAGLPNVSIEEWSRVIDSLKWHSKGLDFADALHLSASARCSEFATFDVRRFARRAQRLGLSPEVKIAT
jgi:hypothetical protein